MVYSMVNLVNSICWAKKYKNIKMKMKNLITIFRSFTIYASVKSSAINFEWFEMLFSWITIMLYYYYLPECTFFNEFFCEFGGTDFKVTPQGLIILKHWKIDIVKIWKIIVLCYLILRQYWMYSNVMGSSVVIVKRVRLFEDFDCVLIKQIMSLIP